MSTKKKVSVALCTHNGERFIEEQIKSILDQTRPVDEIVLSDDASIDRTVEIVKKSITGHLLSHGTAPTLIVLNNSTPLRVTKNFEQALFHTSGDLVALSDQDDVWHSNRIEKMVAMFESTKTLFVFSNARQTDEEGKSLGHDLFTALAMSAKERSLVEQGEAYKQFLRRNLATGATVMLRRSLVKAAAPFPDSWLHDEWLAMVAAAFDSVRMLDERLIDYRQHSGNQVGMSPLRTRRRISMFLEPRTERNERLFLRAQALSDRIGSLISPETQAQVPANYQRMAKDKYLFEQARQKYPELRIKRVPPVFNQLFKGAYARYGTGLKDALRNIIQPV